MGDYTFILKGASVTDTVTASSSAKEEAPPSTSGVGAGPGAVREQVREPVWEQVREPVREQEQEQVRPRSQQGESPLHFF